MAVGSRLISVCGFTTLGDRLERKSRDERTTTWLGRRGSGSGFPRKSGPPLEPLTMQLPKCQLRNFRFGGTKFFAAFLLCFHSVSIPSLDQSMERAGAL